MKKRLIIGFKGITLAPVTKNDVLGYATDAAEALPYAGNMTLSPIEQSQDFNYDDELYAQYRNTSGYNVEIHIAEATLERLAELGLGVYDSTKNGLKYDFTPKLETYSLGYIANTVSDLPDYFLERVFDLLGIRLGDMQTKGDSVTANEVIITGVLRRPSMPGLWPRDRRQLKEDSSNLTECQALIAGNETFPPLP